MKMFFISQVKNKSKRKFKSHVVVDGEPMSDDRFIKP